MRLRVDNPVWAAAAFVALIHGAWWLSAAAGGLQPGLQDPDSYMRLVRVERLVETAGWFDSSIPRTNAPDGGSLHWTRLFDLVLLAIAAPLAPFAGFEKALYFAGTIVNPVLHIACVFALAWAALPLLGRTGAALAGALTASQAGFVGYATVGHADHHILYALATIGAFGFLLRALSAAPGAAGNRHALAAGACIGLGLWVGLEMIVFMALATAAAGLPWLFTGKRGAEVSFRLALGTAAVLLAVVLLERGPSNLLRVEYDRVSIVHLTIAALLAGYWTLVRRWQGKHFGARCAVAGAGAVATLVCLKLLYPGIFEGALAGVEADALPYIVMVNEYRPVPGPAKFLVLFGAVVVAVPWVLWRTWRVWQARQAGAGGERWAWIAVSLCVVFYPALAAGWLRWSSYAGLFLALALAGVALQADAAISRRFTTAARIPIKVVVILALLVGPNAIGIAAFSAGGGVAQKRAAKSCPITAMAEFLNQPPWGTTPLNILASANFGPELLYRTNHRVLATLHHRNVAGILDSVKILQAADEGEAYRLARRRKVDLILLCPGAPDDGYFLWQGGGLYDRLANGDAPAWLAEIKTTPVLEKSFKLFRTFLINSGPG